MNLIDLLKEETAKTTPTKGDKPIGSINLKLAGVNVFSRAIWKEGTSETSFLNEINTYCVENPTEAAQLITKLLGKLEVEVNVKQHSNASLADLLK